MASHDAPDLMDPALHADGPPHDRFAALRAQAPVSWNPTADGTGFWSVTSRELVATASRDTGTFSSYRAGIFLDPDRVVPLDLARNLLLYKDPPEHTKYRAILQSAFTPRTVRGLEEQVRTRVTRVLDAVIERGACDAVGDIAVPVPLGVLAELLGLPESDIPRLGAWTEQIEAAQLAPEPAAAMETFGEMAGYLAEQVERQAASDEESLVTRLRDAEVDGERLDEAEILVFFALLVFAGNDTTRNTTSNGILALTEHPEQWALLVEDPGRAGDAVEEILRWTSVVKWFARTATCDTDSAGSASPRATGSCSGTARRRVTRRRSTTRSASTSCATTRPTRRSAAAGATSASAPDSPGSSCASCSRSWRAACPTSSAPAPSSASSSAWANALTSLPVAFTPGAREAA